MDEREFAAAADAQLEAIEAALDRLCESGTVDIDVETRPGGVIEIECSGGNEAGSKIIVNRHMAAREIWVAARSGGFHFSWRGDQGGRWLATRDGEELMAALARVLSEQCGVPVTL